MWRHFIRSPISDRLLFYDTARHSMKSIITVIHIKTWLGRFQFDVELPLYLTSCGQPWRRGAKDDLHRETRELSAVVGVGGNLYVQLKNNARCAAAARDMPAGVVASFESRSDKTKGNSADRVR